MRKHFLILMLLALLPFTAWAAEATDITGFTAELNGATALEYTGAEQNLPTTGTLSKSGYSNITAFTIKWQAGSTYSASGTDITKFTNAGTYAYFITVSGKSGSVTGTITVGKKLVTYTVTQPDAIKYGDAAPAFKFTYDGFANVDQKKNAQQQPTGKVKDGIVTGDPVITTTYQVGSPVVNGGYPVTIDVTGLSATNYRFAGVNKTLTVNAKPLYLVKTGNVEATAEATVSNMTYNSGARKPIPVVVDKQFGELSAFTTGQNPEPKDFTLEYFATDENGNKTGTALGNVNFVAGDYVVTVTGHGNYSESFDLKYTVNKKTLWVTTLDGANDITYTAKAHTIDIANNKDYLYFEGLEDADKKVDNQVTINWPADAAFVTNSNIAIELWKNGAKVDAINQGEYEVHAVSVNGANDPVATTNDNVLKNYRLFYDQTGKYTIKRAEVTFTLRAQSRSNGYSHPLDNGVTPTAQNWGDYFTDITDLQETAQNANNHAITVYPTLSKGAKIGNTNTYAINADFTNVKIMQTTQGQNQQPVVVDVTDNYTFKVAENGGVYTINKGVIAIRPVNTTATYGEFAADAHKAFKAQASGGTAAENAAIEALVENNIEFKLTQVGNVWKNMGSNGTVEYPAAGVYTLQINTQGIDLGTYADDYDFEWFDGATYTINPAPLNITLNAQSLNVGDGPAALIADEKTVEIEGLQYNEEAAGLYNAIHGAFAFAGHVLDQTAAQAATYYDKDEVYVAKTAIGQMQNGTALGDHYAVLNAVIGTNTYSATTLIENVSNEHKTAMSNATAEQGSHVATTYVKTAEVPAAPKYLDGNGALIAAAANYNAEPVAAPIKGFFGKAITLNNLALANYTVATLVKGDLLVSTAIQGGLILSEREVTNQQQNKVSAKDRLIAANNQKQDVTVKIKRSQSISTKTYNWNAQQFNALVLPFDVTVSELSEKFGYAIVNVVNPEKTTDGNIYWSLAWGTIDANTPFVVRTLNNVGGANEEAFDFGQKTIKYEAEPTVVAGMGYKVVGTYSPVVIDESSNSKKKFFGDNTDHGITAGSKFTWTIYPFDAYLDYTGNTSGREVTLTFEDLNGGTTSISAAEFNRNAVSAEGWYTLNGVKLQGIPTEKGVYINNGKKVVVK